MIFWGHIFRCLPIYCHLVDCIYWAFIANNILHCSIIQLAEQHCPRERELRAGKRSVYFEVLRCMVPPRLQEANFWNLLTVLASVNNPRSYQTTESLISDIAVVWIGIINLNCLFLRCSYYCLNAVPLLRRLVACISLRRTVFDLTQVHMRFVVESGNGGDFTRRTCPLRIITLFS